MNLTFYSTPGHGYLSVSKSTFLKHGGDPEKISGYSGHTVTNLFLEEDCDAPYFLDLLDSKGVKYKVKIVYRNSVSPTHNYDPKLFHFRFNTGLKVKLHDDTVGVLESYTNRTLIHVGHMTYMLPTTNPFKYIKEVVS
jgi:hypothetical protein